MKQNIAIAGILGEEVIHLLDKDAKDTLPASHSKMFGREKLKPEVKRTAIYQNKLQHTNDRTI